MNIISRSTWKARRPKAVTKLSLTKVDAIVIHYSGAFKDESGPFAARVREIQNYHMDVKKWNDIAYNFLVSRDGDIYEGRGFGVQSAATLNNNDHTISICFLGADKEGRDDVTDKGHKAIGALIREIESRKGSKLKVKGHRDYVATACPGQELYAYIATRAWEKGIPLPASLPSWFYTWVAWKLGEGAFKKFGKANIAHRPKSVPDRIPLKVWTALSIFLANRKLS